MLFSLYNISNVSTYTTTCEWGKSALGTSPSRIHSRTMNDLFILFFSHLGIGQFSYWTAPDVFCLLNDKLNTPFLCSKQPYHIAT